MTLPTSAQPGQPPGTNPEKACPICGKPAVKAFRPFCSARCSDVDLNRWLGGVYAIPAAEHEERDDSDGD